jgi:hypothetical protein
MESERDIQDTNSHLSVRNSRMPDDDFDIYGDDGYDMPTAQEGVRITQFTPPSDHIFSDTPSFPGYLPTI